MVKQAPSPFLPSTLHPTAMAVDDFFHNGQAYTQTAALTLTAFLGTPKTL